jgi:hypothetical protein
LEPMSTERSAIIVVVLGDRDPLGSGELLFQVTGDGFLLFSSEGGGAHARLCLVQGLTCGRHGGDESLLLSVTCASSRVLRAAATAVTRTSFLLVVAAQASFLLVAAACCSSTERLEVLFGMVGKTVVVNHRVSSEMSGGEEKIDGSDYHVRERCGVEN